MLSSRYLGDGEGGTQGVPLSLNPIQQLTKRWGHVNNFEPTRAALEAAGATPNALKAGFGKATGHVSVDLD